jgi:hypothetical protein
MTDVLDNNSVAILTKVNEVAERYGIRPYDFVATVQYDVERHASVLAFETVRDSEKETLVSKMLERIGVGQDGALEGTDKQIIDALDNALQRAPKPRRRF